MDVSDALLRDEIRRVFDKWIPKHGSRHEDLWMQWLGHRPRAEPDLRLLASQPVEPFFQARALTVLLAPSPECLPFVWHGQTEYPTWNSDIPVFRDTSSLEVIRFTGELLLALSDALRSVEPTPEVLEKLDIYNFCIIPVLALLDEGDPLAVRLFKSFRINDYRVYDAYTTDGECHHIMSGYNPFTLLMEFRAPLARWKALADQAMRRVVLDEFAGHRTSRAAWEGAYERYVWHLVGRCGAILNTEGQGETEEKAVALEEYELSEEEAALLYGQIRFVLELMEAYPVADPLEAAGALVFCQIFPEGEVCADVCMRIARLLVARKIKCGMLSEEMYAEFLQCLAVGARIGDDEPLALALEVLILQDEIESAAVSQRYTWECRADARFFALMSKR